MTACLLTEVCKDVSVEPLLTISNNVMPEIKRKNGYVERILLVSQHWYSPFKVEWVVKLIRFNKLSDMIANKRKEPTSVITNWIRTKLNFSLLKSCLLCLRGSRTPWNATRNINIVSCLEKLLLELYQYDTVYT